MLNHKSRHERLMDIRNNWFICSRQRYPFRVRDIIIWRYSICSVLRDAISIKADFTMCFMAAATLCCAGKVLRIWHL